MAYNSVSPIRKRYPYSKPTVSTSTTTNIASTSLTANGNVSNQGTTTVSVRGFCYSTVSNPYITNSTTVTSGGGTGTFSASITGLTPNTTYYIKAYATNSIGTSYGSQKTILTTSAGIATVTTTPPTDIFATTITAGGNVTSIGGSSVTEKGICYSLTPSPTTSNTKVSIGSGTGSYSQTITGLTPYTNYYIRAYAINSQGTSYGNQETFQTAQVPSIDFGLYFDSFSATLGDPTATSFMLNFFNEKQITQPIFYLASLLDDADNRTDMRAINTSLNNQNITDIAANVTQAANVIDPQDAGSIAGFNEDSTEDTQKFTTVVEEIEFYKSNPYVNSFAEYQTNCDLIKEWADANGVIYQAYYARCRDCATVNPQTSAQIATYMVQTFETLKLVDYVSTEKFNQYNGLSASIKAEIELIAVAAQAQGKVQNMELIFASQGNVVSGVPTNMRTYFQANPTITPAYNQVMSEYNNWDFLYKSYINLKGFTVYAKTGIYDL